MSSGQRFGGGHVFIWKFCCRMCIARMAGSWPIRSVVRHLKTFSTFWGVPNGMLTMFAMIGSSTSSHTLHRRRECSSLMKRDFLKRHKVGRQYSGTAGRVRNCQTGVFLAYRSAKGHALIDRELSLPKAWCEDRTWCREARIPDTRAFATKPALARGILERAVAARIPARWVAADEVS